MVYDKWPLRLDVDTEYQAWPFGLFLTRKWRGLDPDLSASALGAGSEAPTEACIFVICPSTTARYQFGPKSSSPR